MIKYLKNIKIPYNLIIILIICIVFLFILNTSPSSPSTNNINSCYCKCNKLDTIIKLDSSKLNQPPINIYISNEIKYSKK